MHRALQHCPPPPKKNTHKKINKFAKIMKHTLSPCRTPAGFPLSWGLASIDPGFTFNNVFSVSEEDVSGLDPGTGGSCQSTFSTSVTYSTSSFTESTSVE
jgi:hypothetical protein